MKILRFTAASLGAALGLALGPIGTAHATSPWSAPRGLTTDIVNEVTAMTVGQPGQVFVSGPLYTSGPDTEYFNFGVLRNGKITPIPDAPSGWANSMTYDTSTRTLFVAGSVILDGVEYAVVQWDGVTWEGIAQVSVESTIYVITDNDKGTLYAGGHIEDVNGEEGYQHLAEYSNSDWRMLGGLNGTVTSIVVDSRGTIYVAGDFTENYAQWTYGGVAIFDGRSWSLLGVTEYGVDTLAMSRGGILYGWVLHGRSDDRSARLLQWRRGTARQWTPVPLPRSRALESQIASMSFNSRGDLLIAYDGAVSSYRPATATWTEYPGVFTSTFAQGSRALTPSVTFDGRSHLVAVGDFQEVDGISVPAVAIRPIAQVPGPPTGLHASGFPGRVLITWSPGPSEPRADLFRAECTRRDSRIYTAETQLPFVEMALPRGRYTCRASARNSAGWGPWSEPVSLHVQ